MWSFVGEKEERFVFQPELAAFAEARQRHWTTHVPPGIEVAIERFLETGFVVEKGSCVERFVAQEIVGASVKVLAATFWNYVDDGPAVVAVFCTVVVAQHFHFRNCILIDREAQLVWAARLACEKTIDRRNSWTAALSGDVWEVGPKAVARAFDVVVVWSAGKQAKERRDVAAFGTDQVDLIGCQSCS